MNMKIMHISAREIKMCVLQLLLCNTANCSVGPAMRLAETEKLFLPSSYIYRSEIFELHFQGLMYILLSFALSIAKRLFGIAVLNTIANNGTRL